jgi:restriction system protein
VTSPEHAWMVRAGDNNELAGIVEDKNAVAIGWADMGDLSKLETREETKACYQQVYQATSSSRINVNGGQLYRFAHAIVQGDYVLTYDQSSRELVIGVCNGPYTYKPDLLGERYPHIRPVRWIRRVSRDVFGSPARNSMGSSLTIFSLDQHLAEIEAAAAGQVADQIEEIEDDAPPFYDEVKAKADELISDLISRIDPYDFQDLVAGLLQAMGFHAVSSPKGTDRGVDIVAHPDAFGFERPRIKVQVKHRRGPVGGPDLRQFIATLRESESGLYVSTGGFKGDAQLEAERSREPVALMDADGFVRLLLDHYENLDPEYKAKVPLRKLWMPTE